MKYLCLVYLDETALDVLSRPELDALAEEAAVYDAALRSRGHCVAAEALQPAQAVATVRVRNGRLTVAAGPMVEMDQRLVRFYLIDARDLNDAIQVASKLPHAGLGSVEIHPIRDGELP